MGEVVVVEVPAVASGDPRGALGATRLVVGDTKILPRKFEKAAILCDPIGIKTFVFCCAPL